MAGYRIVRINDDIKRELAQLIPNLKDPRVRGLISITRVDTTPDLRYCKVYVSALDKGDGKDMVKGLKSASGYLRRELAKRMTLRYTPELIFTWVGKPAPPIPVMPASLTISTISSQLSLL